MTNLLKPTDCIYCESEPHAVCPCSCSHAPCVHTLKRLRAELDEERELARRGMACHEVTARDRDKAEAELAKLRALDDPDMDATDGAHPAWWRGHDHTAKVFGEKLVAWLRGEDDLKGSMSEPWQTIRFQIAGLLLAASQTKTPAYLGDDPERLKGMVHLLVGALRWLLSDSTESARSYAVGALSHVEGEGIEVQEFTSGLCTHGGCPQCQMEREPNT